MPATFALVLSSIFVASEAVASGKSQDSISLSALGSAFEEADAAKESPIQRVVKLLQEMKAQLEKEVSGDAELYDKMVCWCETNDKEKTKAIADADTSLNDLQADIESRAAREGQLGTKIAALKEELAQKKAALKKATEIREKERAEFYAEENEAVQAVTMLKNAIQILSKHHAGLIQMTPALQESMNSALRWAALKHEEMLEMNIEPSALRGHDSNRASMASLLAVASSAGQAKDAASAALDERMLTALQGSSRNARADVPLEFGSRILERAAKQAAALVQTAQPAPFQSYAPQSSQIFGILKQMKEDFEANLSIEQKEELKAAEVFDAFKAASIKAIDAGSAKLDEMEEEFAGNTKALSDAKEDFETTQAQRSADVKFLTDLKVKCQELDREYASRSKARNDEVKAISEAIAILTDDDARSLFDKKMGGGAGEVAASFIQTKASNTAAMQARNRAYTVLMTAAQRLQQSPDLAELYKVYRASEDKPHQQLATIAVKVQLDAFTKVKKAIDDMVADLKGQQEKEVAKKALCTKELDDNEKMTYTTKEELDDLKDKIKGLETTIQKLTDEIAAAKVEIAETKVALKEASEDREKENAEFQEEITDQRTMQAILKKALDRMQQVYGKSLLQQEPPVKFQPYKQNAGSSPVIGLMEQIIGDSKKVENEALAGEQESQKAYEDFVRNSNDSINALTEGIQSKSDAVAEAALQKTEAETEKKSTEDRLQSLVEYNADLHADCDYVLTNFGIRQKARLQEIEALQSAKAYLSGMQDNQ
jgi:chromosome segregation ATPase